MNEEQILEMLENRQYKELRIELERMYPVDLAELLEEFDEKQRIIVFRLLSKESAADTFTYLNSDMREVLINALTDSEIKEVMDDLKEKRVTKQPLEYASAGSTFKRPEGYFAGKLIEDAGLRGFRVGDAQVSEKHCGFVINRGNASAAEVMELMRQVEDKVEENSGVRLEAEVRRIGEF